MQMMLAQATDKVFKKNVTLIRSLLIESPVTALNKLHYLRVIFRRQDLRLSFKNRLGVVVFS